MAFSKSVSPLKSGIVAIEMVTMAFFVVFQSQSPLATMAIGVTIDDRYNVDNSDALAMFLVAIVDNGEVCITF